MSINNKRLLYLTMAPTHCPICFFCIKKYQINKKQAVYLCSNTECVYPLGRQGTLEFEKQYFKKLAREIDDEKSKGNEEFTLDANFLESIFDNQTSTTSEEDIEEVEKLFESLSKFNDESSTKEAEEPQKDTLDDLDELISFFNNISEGGSQVLPS